MYFNEWFGTWFGDWFGDVDEEEVLYGVVEIVYYRPSLRLAEIHRLRNAEIKLEPKVSANILRNEEIKIARPRQIPMIRNNVKINRSRSINPNLYR